MEKVMTGDEDVKAALYTPGERAESLRKLAVDEIATFVHSALVFDYVYLASPYSHPDPVMMVARYEAATREAGRLMKEGWNVFSPIAHSHVVANRTALPTTWDYWREVDRVFLKQSGAVFVYMLTGWDKSTGVQAEIEMAKGLRIPVYYLHPDGSLYEEC